jgi:UDP-glucose 4-epimerase
MPVAGGNKLVFSSSATLYGNGANVPIKETELEDRAINSYGRSKRIVEQLLSELPVVTLVGV